MLDLAYKIAPFAIIIALASTSFILGMDIYYALCDGIILSKYGSKVLSTKDPLWFYSIIIIRSVTMMVLLFVSLIFVYGKIQDRQIERMKDIF